MTTSTRLNREDISALLTLVDELGQVERWNTFAVAGDLRPAIKIRHNRTKRGIGHFSSRKMALRMPYVSSLERDLLYLLESDPSVSAFLTQPIVLNYLDRGDAHSHLPDVVSLVGSRVTLVEVKYADEAAEEEIARRTALFKNLLAPHKISYRLLTETAIRLEPRLTIARMLSRYRWHTPDPEVVLEMATLLKNGEDISIRQAADEFSEPIAAATSIFSALLRGDIAVKVWADPLEDSILRPV